jgi:hypothetical protein
VVTLNAAAKYYIIKWNNTGADLTGTNLVFDNVTVSNGKTDIVTEWIDFCGTFSPENINTASKTTLYLDTDNKLCLPTTETFQVKSCRAYFQLKGLTVGDTSGQNNVRAFNINLGDGESQGITTANYTDSSDAWYTLDGRKIDGVGVSSVPTHLRKGLYIHNGRKVVVK